MDKLKVRDKDKRIDDIDKIKRVIEKNSSNVMIFGAGAYAKVLKEYLEINKVAAPIVFVVDDEYLKNDPCEGDIISFSEFITKYAKTSPLVFGIYDYEIISAKRRQFEKIVPYMFDFHMTVIGDYLVDWNYEYVTEHYEEFNQTFNMLCSKRSKETMQGYINAEVAGQFTEFYEKSKDKIPYFNDKIQDVKIDRLFDCGAFDGDSAHDFVCAFKDYKQIFEFEPDPKNVEKIMTRVKNESIRDLTIVSKGVWSETTTLRFSSTGKSSSNVSSEGDICIDVIKLDDMYDEFTPTSLIKMDIEGSELEALKGATRVIGEISPALAICVYHKRDDLITIPQYIDSLVPHGTYNYYIGYQGVDLAELVFYAIPRDM